MLFLVAIMYWLLCVRLQVQIDVSCTHKQGSVVFSVGAFGLYWNHEAAITRKKEGIGLCLTPIHEKQGGEKKPVVQQMIQQALIDYLRGIVRRRDFAHLSLYVRVGLGDASETAVAAGTIRALAAALFAVSAHPQACELRVTPEFSGECLHVCCQGIFFCQPGDIILAALKAARRKRKEGSKWINIPSRA